MDTVVTLEGRRQIASGKLRVDYVSFTDAAAYYKADVVSGSADASTRIYLEQSHLPQDQITFEADDSGRLKPFGNGDGTVVKDGQILVYSFNASEAVVVSGSNDGLRFLKGDEFASTAETLLASSVDNFSKLRIIGTRDKIFEDDGFALGNSSIEFVINNEKPVKDEAQRSMHVDYLESLFNDVRLGGIRNFQYLPPLNKVDDKTLDKKDYRKTWKHHLGHYRPWGKPGGVSPKQLEYELQQFEKMGYCRSISIDPTSRDNRLVGQFFEVNYNVLKKLDVIDYGKYSIGKGAHRHAFFVGKVVLDGNGTNSFVHIFTLVFG